MKRIEYILVFNQLFNVLANNLLTPVYTTFVKKIGGDLLTAGIAIGLNAAVMGLVILISGKVAQRYHTERLELVVGYTVLLLASVGYLRISSPFQLFLVQMISGLGLAIAQPSFNGSFSAIIKRGNYTMEWADYLGIAYFVIALAAIISGILTQVFGFTALFILMITAQGVSVLGAIYLYLNSRKYAMGSGL